MYNIWDEKKWKKVDVNCHRSNGIVEPGIDVQKRGNDQQLTKQLSRALSPDVSFPKPSPAKYRASLAIT